mgnify:CR=1 FL=1
MCRASSFRGEKCSTSVVEREPRPEEHTGGNVIIQRAPVEADTSIDSFLCSLQEIERNLDGFLALPAYVLGTLAGGAALFGS